MPSVRRLPRASAVQPQRFRAVIQRFGLSADECGRRCGRPRGGGVAKGSCGTESACVMSNHSAPPAASNKVPVFRLIDRESGSILSER